MPPDGLRSRKAAMGEASPKGSNSSILVLGSVTNTTLTPCAGWAMGSETSAPSMPRYCATAPARLGTAMATWLRRPSILHLLRASRAQSSDTLHAHHPAAKDGNDQC